MLLHLVRHGRSAADPDMPAATWVLSDDAAVGVLALRDSGAVPSQARWCSSPEPKALLTAALLHPSGAGVEDDFREAERAVGWFTDAGKFADAVRRSFDRPDRPAVEGWEPLASTRLRLLPAVRATLDRARSEADGLDVVLVGHGTAWTLLVSELTRQPPDLAAWAVMTMPDHCSIDVNSGRVVSPWGGWRAAALPTV